LCSVFDQERRVADEKQGTVADQRDVTIDGEETSSGHQALNGIDHSHDFALFVFFTFT
jgi:hypothetical protein